MRPVDVLKMQLCTVLVVVGMTAELSRRIDDRIVSQWREISADEQHQLRDEVDEILRPLGDEISLLVTRHFSRTYMALYFICLTLSAVTSLRDQWRSRQLRDIVESLFTLLSMGSTRRVHDLSIRCQQSFETVKRLTWPLTDYERCSDFISSAQRK